MRLWKGTSGQVWKEVSRTDTHITLHPEYSYFDSESNTATMYIPLVEFNRLNFTEEKPSDNPRVAGQTSDR